MKKILLATTAVAMTAGAAYAEVAVSGNARMGLQYNDATGNTTIEKRMTINLDGSTETTSGITFGARMRLRSNEAGGTVAAGARVYMKTGGFEMAMGNINGAIESMPGLYDASAGLTGLGWGGLSTNVVGADGIGGAGNADQGYWGWDSYSSSGNGVEGIEVMYTGGAFTGHLSYSEAVLSGIPGAEERIAVYGAYTMSDWTFALGLQDSSNNFNDKVVLTVGGKIGDYGVGLAYADNDGVGKISLNGSATFGATTVNAYVADEDSVGATDVSYGLGVSYDLGGASVVGGISHSEIGVNRADLGVSFSF